MYVRPFSECVCGRVIRIIPVNFTRVLLYIVLERKIHYSCRSIPGMVRVMVCAIEITPILSGSSRTVSIIYSSTLEIFEICCLRKKNFVRGEGYLVRNFGYLEFCIKGFFINVRILFMMARRSSLLCAF